MLTITGKRTLLAALLMAVWACGSAHAQGPGPTAEFYDGRQMLVYTPQRLPSVGRRALVVVLHGGLGNAERISSERSEAGLNMDDAAAKYGFIVA